jgi:hypothetical protein
MKIVLTVREAKDRGLWDGVCDQLHISAWAVNEGQMDNDDEVTLSEEQAIELGLIAARRPSSW